LGHPIALEPEGGGIGDTLFYSKVLQMAMNKNKFLNQMGWGYWDYDFIPAVDKWKVKERPSLSL